MIRKNLLLLNCNIKANLFGSIHKTSKCQFLATPTCSRFYNTKKIYLIETSKNLTQRNILANKLSSYSKPPSQESTTFDDENFLPSDSDDETKEQVAKENEVFLVENEKENILAAAMPFVLEYGWSKEAVAKGAQSVGLSVMSHLMMPNDGYELVSYHYKQANGKLGEYLKEKAKDKGSTTLFIEDAIKYRLSLNIPYMHIWPEAMVLMTQPWNIADSLKNMASLMDDIWFYAEDKSLDYNYYTKRGITGAIYKATELHMVGQEPGSSVEDYEETWQFLKKRMSDAMFLKSFLNAAQKTPEIVTSIYEISKNVLSLNNLNRKY